MSVNKQCVAANSCSIYYFTLNETGSRKKLRAHRSYVVSHSNFVRAKKLNEHLNFKWIQSTMQIQQCRFKKMCWVNIGFVVDAICSRF